MIYLIISIIASVSVSILLKIARKNNIDIVQAVAFNYPIAILMGFIFLKPNFSNFQVTSHWYLYLILGILLPSVFVIMGRATQLSGIVKADTAQRLSLVFTLLVAFFVWKEPFGIKKILGICVAFIALLLLLNKSEKLQKGKSNLWILPVVWLGYGLVDLMFKLISKTGSTAFGTNLIISFSIATFLIWLYIGYMKSKLNVQSIIGGIILGILNFTNIYTYIKAHQVMSENPSIVFTGMNIGVIAIGTVVGLFIFQEKLNKFNYLGILLAIISVLILFL